MKKIFILPLAAALSLILSVSLVSCKAAPDRMRSIQESGTLKVVLSSDDAPYSYSPDNGNGYLTPEEAAVVTEDSSSEDEGEVVVAEGTQPVRYATGTDVDLAREIAADLGVTLEIYAVPREEIMKHFNRNKYDLVIGRFSSDDNAGYNYLTSAVYASQKVYAVTPVGVYFPTVDAMKGLDIAVAPKMSRFNSQKLSESVLHEYSDLGLVSTAVLGNTVHAYVCYRYQAFELIKNKQLTVHNIIDVNEEHYVLLANRSDVALMVAANKTIKRLKEADALANYPLTWVKDENGENGQLDASETAVTKTEPSELPAQTTQSAVQQTNPSAQQPAAQQTNPPVQQTAQPAAQQTNPPVQQTARPAAQQTNPPVQQTAQPAAQQTRPPVQQTAQPAVQQTRPPVQATQPPVQQTRPPVQQATQPPVQQTRPPVQQATQPPVQQTRPPVQQATQPPVQQGTRPPVQQVTQPPVQQGSVRT